MFKKIAGLFLAAAVMCSSAAITASAAEAEDDAAVAAADQSGEVSADGSSEVSADASSEVEAGNVIKFDVKKSGWNNVKTVFCHVWKADGSGDWPAWQSKKEKCKYDSSTGIATYDLSKTGNTISKSDGRVYCVIFSANTGMQSYNAIMSGKCIGDTLYCTGNQLENPEDCELVSQLPIFFLLHFYFNIFYSETQFLRFSPSFTAYSNTYNTAFYLCLCCICLFFLISPIINIQLLVHNLYLNICNTRTMFYFYYRIIHPCMFKQYRNT